MRIAQIAPLYESVPPKLYGGTERVVAYLTDELVRLGHDVTLFASGDSQTPARLVPTGESSIRLDPGCKDPLARHILMLEKVFRRAQQFDVMHFHVDYLHFPLSRRYGRPNLTTLHGRLDIPDFALVHNEYREMPVVSISNAQRAPLPHLNWLATVPHGLPPELYRYADEPPRGGYLAFVGRISPEKRPDRAVRIAERAGVKLVIAAKVDRADVDYFEAVVRPLLSNPWVEYIGEVGERDKHRLLCGARALLFPIDWPEPFGLVMIEAMACGTPTIAYRCGSVPEIIDEGVTGFIVEDELAAVRAVQDAVRIDRAECRRRFDQRFSIVQTARAYVSLYEQLAGSAADTGLTKDERAA